MTNRRIARPEDVASREGVLDAIAELGPPWHVHGGPAIARALGISVLSFADWRYNERAVPPHEPASVYPRAKGHLYRADKFCHWARILSGAAAPDELWRIGSAYLRDVLGLPEPESREATDDLIVNLQRSGILSTPAITPTQWPYRPYAYEDDGR